MEGVVFRHIHVASKRIAGDKEKAYIKQIAHDLKSRFSSDNKQQKQKKMYNDKAISAG